MNIKDSLGDRMKTYESVSRNYLTRRVPAIIRADGKAFHTLTKGMEKPFDRLLMTAMQLTMKALCEKVQGCVFGYTQSDEITLVLTDYETITTDAWYEYNVQKMTSVAASIATQAFNGSFSEAVEAKLRENAGTGEERDYLLRLRGKYWKALFDARAFSVPKEEVCNCLIWRQKDATRNSIESVGQAYFNQRQLHGLSCDQIQELVWKEKSVNWNDFPTDCKRGACCVKKAFEEDMADPRDPNRTIHVVRRRWVIDREPPIFTQDRAYIERLI